MITREDVRRLVRERALHADAEDDLPYDAHIVLDSMSLTWLLHALEQEYGIVISPSDDELDQLTSIDAIHRYVQRATSRGDGTRRHAE